MHVPALTKSLLGREVFWPTSNFRAIQHHISGCTPSKVINWWIGDWWAYGSHRYGERARAAAEGTFGREFSTLVHAASVSRAFETGRRRPLLSFSHYREVASLPAEEADALLAKTEAEGGSTRDLRQAVESA